THVARADREPDPDEAEDRGPGVARALRRRRLGAARGPGRGPRQAGQARHLRVVVVVVAATAGAAPILVVAIVAIVVVVAVRRGAAVVAIATAAPLLALLAIVAIVAIVWSGAADRSARRELGEARLLLGRGGPRRRVLGLGLDVDGGRGEDRRVVIVPRARRGGSGGRGGREERADLRALDGVARDPL